MSAVPPTQVLHVEDDPGVQALVRATLVQQGGFEVRTAANGMRAIELAVLRRPDIVLLDLDLPGMNGIDTLKTLRSREALRCIPYVFLTASRDPLTHIEVLSLGAHSVVYKPFRPMQLVQALERALHRKEI